MEYKILESNGVEIENIDGAAFNHFSSMEKSGAIKGILQECLVYPINSTRIGISTGELLLHGFRVKITSSHELSLSTLVQSTPCQIIARLTVGQGGVVSFNIINRVSSGLAQTFDFRTNVGMYELEMARYTNGPSGISELISVVPVISLDNSSLESRFRKIEDTLDNHEFRIQKTSEKLSALDKRVKNIEEGVPPEKFIVDDTISYVKTVPEGILSSALVTKVGGMSHVVDGNLIHAKVTTVKSIGVNHIKSTATSQAINGITFTVNADKSIAVNGTANDIIYYTVGSVTLSQGTYHLSGCVSGGSNERWFLYVQGQSPYDYGNGASFEVSETLTKNVIFRISPGAAINGVIKPMLNIGDTALPYRPHMESSLPIPAAVQALPDYGLGVSATVNNHVDWSERKYHKTCGVVDLGTLPTPTRYDVAEGTLFRFTVEGIKRSADSAVIPNILCSKYTTTTTSDRANKTISMPVNIYNVDIIDNDYSDGASFKAAMSGVTLVYELAEPAVVDIFYDLSEDSYLIVQEGGQIVAENEYKLGAFTEIIYQKE